MVREIGEEDDDEEEEEEEDDDDERANIGALSTLGCEDKIEYDEINEEEKSVLGVILHGI